MRDSVNKDIKKFNEVLDLWGSAYQHAFFTFCARQSSLEVYDLLHAQLHLVPIDTQLIQKPIFKNDSLIVGACYLKEHDSKYQDVLSNFFKNFTLDIEGVQIRLVYKNEDSILSSFKQLTYDGTLKQSRISSLRIQGDDLNFYASNDLAWELLAADVPYSSLDELLGEYYLPKAHDIRQSCFEVFAEMVVGITKTSVANEKAIVSLALPVSLDKEKASIGYRIVGSSEVIRGKIQGKDLSWSEPDKKEFTSSFVLGEANISIPAGSTVHCIANYADVSHHQVWLTDPDNSLNLYKNLMEENDPNLGVLKKFLFGKKGKERSRDFEAAVSWLFSIMGFNVSYYGANNLMTDAPDIIAYTPNNDLFVIECTLGLLKTDSKVPKLIERTAKFKKRAESSGYGNVSVVPVIITQLNHDEVSDDIEELRKKRVCVLTRQDLEDMLASTGGAPAPQKFFDEKNSTSSFFNIY